MILKKLNYALFAVFVCALIVLLSVFTMREIKSTKIVFKSEANSSKILDFNKSNQIPSLFDDDFMGRDFLNLKTFDKLSRLDFKELKALKTLNAKAFFIKAPTKMAHASNLSLTKCGVMVLFFAGSQEGSPDVGIWQSFLDENLTNHADRGDFKGNLQNCFENADLKSQDKNPIFSQNFTLVKKILSPKMLSKMSGKFVKKLGNPVAFTDAQGKMHLFVVGVSLGGWATSKIYQLEFDEKNVLKFRRELVLSGFANFSHLVRNPPVLLENGGFILPIYHELATKYALLLEFDKNANLISITRPNALKSQLQPSLIALNSNSALMIFRNHNFSQNTAFMQFYKDNAWQSPIKTNLKNYDSALALFLWDDRVFLVHNDGIKPRSRLSLYELKNGEFSRLLTLDRGEELSYPSVLVDKNTLFLSYTNDRKFIKLLKIDLNLLERLKK